MQKNNKYYSETRPELLKYYPIGIKKLLDIGCSSATFSSTLKSRSPIEIWGIEMNEASAEVAKQKIDKVLVGDVNEIVETLPINYFDCIGCNDILEHLYNPEDLLVNLKKTILHKSRLHKSSLHKSRLHKSRLKNHQYFTRGVPS